MVASDSLPEVFRASDEDRDDVIRKLRDGSAEGRLSQETFLARVDRALRAKSAEELARLHDDLPAPPRPCASLPCRAGRGRPSPSAGPRIATSRSGIRPCRGCMPSCGAAATTG